jgi:hypothetical protein
LWGKRDSDLNFDVSSLDNGMADADLAEEESGEDMKRAWSLLKGGWGKRAPVWGNLRGQFSFHITDSQSVVHGTLVFTRDSEKKNYTSVRHYKYTCPVRHEESVKGE